MSDLEAVTTAASMVFHWRRRGAKRALCGAPYRNPYGWSLWPVAEAYDPTWYEDKECRRCARLR